MSCNNCNGNVNQYGQNRYGRQFTQNRNGRPPYVPPCQTPPVSCRRKDGCDIGKEPVDDMMPAMAFVPWQKWQDVYCVEDAISHGTIFSELEKPYVGRCRL